MSKFIFVAVFAAALGLPGLSASEEPVTTTSWATQLFVEDGERVHVMFPGEVSEEERSLVSCYRWKSDEVRMSLEVIKPDIYDRYFADSSPEELGLSFSSGEMHCEFGTCTVASYEGFEQDGMYIVNVEGRNDEGMIRVRIVNTGHSLYFLMLAGVADEATQALFFDSFEVTPL